MTKEEKFKAIENTIAMLDDLKTSFSDLYNNKLELPDSLLDVMVDVYVGVLPAYIKLERQMDIELKRLGDS